MVWRNSFLLCETHRLRETLGEGLGAVTDTEEDMDRMLITDDSHVKRSSMCVCEQTTASSLKATVVTRT